MRVIAFGVLVAFTALVAFATPTWAQAPGRKPDDRLAEAKRLEALLEFEPALAIVEKLIVDGRATRDRFLELHVLAGKLAAGLDRPTLAEEHFARVVTLVPTFTLPEGTSPKITEPLEAARTRALPLKLRVELGFNQDIGRHSPPRPYVTIRVKLDSLKLVDHIEVIHADGTIEHDSPGRAFDLGVNGHRVEARALDRAGNELWREVIESPLVWSEPPFYKHPHVWAIAGGVTLIGTLVAGSRFRIAQEEFDKLKGEGTDYTALQSVETRGRRWGLVTNISLGLTAISAVGFVYTLFSPQRFPYLVSSSDSVALGVVGRF